MTLPKLIILDRDNTLNYSSSDPDSPLYYITRVEDLVIKNGVAEAVRLIQAHGIPIVLATKQRCIGKKIVGYEQVAIINTRLQRVLNLHLDGLYVEESAEDKSALYQQIIAKYKGSIRPEHMVLFDDSRREINVAQSLGIQAYDGSDLLSAVKTLLHIS